MRLSDEQLSMLLGEHDVGYLIVGGYREDSGYRCMLQCAFNVVVIDDHFQLPRSLLNMRAASGETLDHIAEDFDQEYQPDWSADEWLQWLEAKVQKP